MTAATKPSNVARQRAPQQPSQQQPTVSKPKKGAVIGKARNLSIKAAKRFANVFVARLDPNENEVSIKRHLESTLKLDVTVELCKQSDSQSSFNLNGLCPDPSVFMSDDLWPEGTYLRWWRQPKPKLRTGSTDTTVQQGAAPVEISPDADTPSLAVTLEYLYTYRVASTHDLNAILFPPSSEHTVRCSANCLTILCYLSYYMVVKYGGMKICCKLRYFTGNFSD